MDLSRLPRDIQLHILSYTYRSQPEALCEDIRNFVETKEELLQKYHRYWIVRLGMSFPTDRYWLLNDFFYYANHYKQTLFGYSEPFYRVFRRGYGLERHEAVDAFVRKLGTKSLETQINVVLGLFTPDQRDDLCVNNMMF